MEDETEGFLKCCAGRGHQSWVIFLWFFEILHLQIWISNFFYNSWYLSPPMYFCFSNIVMLSYPRRARKEAQLIDAGPQPIRATGEWYDSGISLAGGRSGFLTWGIPIWLNTWEKITDMQQLIFTILQNTINALFWSLICILGVGNLNQTGVRNFILGLRREQEALRWI